MGKRLIRLFCYEVYRSKILSHSDLRKMRYGMEVIFNEMTKILILLALFTVLNKLMVFLFSLIIIITIRCSSGGLHFKKNFSCLLLSAVFFSITVYSPDYLPIGLLKYSYLALVLSIGSIGALSPITSVNRPIRSKRKQQELKATAVTLTVFWSYILLFKTQSPALMGCGIVTIVLQALQLIISRIFGLVHHIDSGRKLSNGSNKYTASYSYKNIQY